jgi:hypothetical protein
MWPVIDRRGAIAYNGLVAEEIVSREEARATLSARRELGEEFDDALVESFARRVEERLVLFARLR